MTEEETTAYFIWNKLYGLVHEKIVRLRQEVDNLTEAFNLREFDDLVVHADTAYGDLIIIASHLSSMQFLFGVRDGSWPEEEAN